MSHFAADGDVAADRGDDVPCGSVHDDLAAHGEDRVPGRPVDTYVAADDDDGSHRTSGGDRHILADLDD